VKGTRWRHRVRLTEYEVIDDQAQLQCSEARVVDGVLCVIYRSLETTQVYVRPREEFLDGRFEQIVES
jgi:hypothetical protein